MGLYLCVFKGETEIEGVEVGSYNDFGLFREKVEEYVENKRWGEVCPTLMLHSDCDGEWTVEEVRLLKSELQLVKDIFADNPPAEFDSNWQKEIKKLLGLKTKNLYESFIDIDGEILIDRLMYLCEISIRENEPILFQ